MLCNQGHNLPRGLKCDRGYLVLTIRHEGRIVAHPGCGLHTKQAEVLAKERLFKIRSEIERGKFGYEPELPEKTFEQVVPIYLKFWTAERNGDGTLKHNERAIKETEWAILRNLNPFFGKMKYHLISATDVERRREQRIQEGVLGTTVNREHVPLSSIFTHIARWMELGRIEKFKIPAKNPCEAATKAELRVHEKILTDYEVKKLFNACRKLDDLDGLEICKLILKSVLSIGDLKRLEAGQTIDLERAKTGVPVKIPITLLEPLRWTNWPTRWKRIRREAFGDQALDRHSPEYVDAKVLRKTGLNWQVGKFDIKLTSQYAGHASTKTTEAIYIQKQAEKLRPVAEFMDQRVKELESGGLDGI